MLSTLIGHNIVTIPFNGMKIFERPSYVYLGTKSNANELIGELDRRKWKPWGAFSSVEEVLNARLCAHLKDTTIPLALTYAY